MAKKNLRFTEVEVSRNFPTGISTHVDWEPRTNVVETEDGKLWIIEVELPGVDKNDISICIEESSHLVVRGIKHKPRIENCSSVTYFLFEREFGTFYKRVNIDPQVDEAHIHSSMENGVLTIRIPRKKEEPAADKPESGERIKR
ncbi:MAG: Hsp20/alpha crystallin family protein [Candidatus Omnitrophota bacterium]